MSPSDASSPDFAIVIPVRNAESLLPTCLGPIVDQLGDADELVVIDDASIDDTAQTAERCGARVLRRDAPGGPYAARNDGWAATEQAYLLFTDVRCVARPGWLERFREAARAGPDLIFSDILVRGGPRIAERVAAHRQHLLARHYVDTPYFLPYFPTANLAVRRDALAAVSGFRVMPSGGDADLCWRIQLAGFDGISAIREELMEWTPRTTVRELLEQWSKYGASNARLRVEFTDRGAPVEPPLSPWHAVARQARRTLPELRHCDDRQVVALDGCVSLAHELAYGRTLRSLRRSRADG